jgi:flagellar basal-body rod protein FlgC
MTAISTALSGLQASVTRLDGAASNIANQRTRGPVPATPPGEPRPVQGAENQPRVYQAVETVQTAEKGGGVRAQHRPTAPSYLVEYEPESPYANPKGEVAAPAADPVQDMADQLLALRTFQASLSTIQTKEQMEEAVISLKV